MSPQSIKEKSFVAPVAIVSVAIPLVVVYLFYLTPPQVELGFNLSLLPAFHASLNFATALLLLLGRYFILNKNLQAHKYSMISAFALSVIFLLSYVTYHLLTEPTKYGGAGIMKVIYLSILITHIVLAALILPLILLTMIRALQERFDKHKVLAKLTWPLWLYVAVTGVLVYLMLAPYY
jgi:putative membrane protein